MIYMKARFNHYISKGFVLFLAVVLLLAGVHAAAQGPYEEALRLNPFMAGSNIAGIRGQIDKTVLLLPNKGKGKKAVSYAGINGVYMAGGFRSADEAVSAWGAGAEAATIMHLPKISMAGSFSFAQKDGKDMAGSMFIHPDYYPIDAVEFTPGRKTLQEYGFSGGFSSELSSHWLFGAKIDFKSANYSKRKDIRHTNFALDIEVVPSCLYRSGNWNLGVSYIFRKTSEYIKAERLGSASADTYYAFLDKGLVWGTYQVWSGNGLHLAEAGIDRLPVKENTHGAGLQVQHRKGFYLDMEYRFSQGEVGEKGFLWYRFPGRELAANLSYIALRPETRHIFNLHYVSKAQLNQESVIDKVTTGGVANPKVYGYNNIFNRSSLDISTRYDLYYKHLVEFHSTIGYCYNKMVSTLVYPYSDTESFHILNLFASMLYRLGYFEIGVEIGFMKGFGWQAMFGTSDTGSSGLKTEPFRLKDRYNICKEYLIASRISPGFVVRFFVSGDYINGIYVGAKLLDVHAFGLKNISGSDRWQAMFEIGYRF